MKTPTPDQFRSQAEGKHKHHEVLLMMNDYVLWKECLKCGKIVMVNLVKPVKKAYGKTLRRLGKE